MIFVSVRFGLRSTGTHYIDDDGLSRVWGRGGGGGYVNRYSKMLAMIVLCAMEYLVAIDYIPSAHLIWYVESEKSQRTTLIIYVHREGE